MKHTKLAKLRQRRSAELKLPTDIKAAVGRATGRRHESAGLDCQDAVLRKIGQNFTAIALADGAGTAKHSAEGAATVTKTVIEFLNSHFQYLLTASYEDTTQKIIEALQLSLGSKTVQLNCLTTDLASTLLFFATDGKSFVTGQVGDGRIAVRDAKTKIWSSIFEGQKGEFFNETTFVTSRGIHENIQLIRGDMGCVSACILMSDGAEESLYQRKTRIFASAMETIASWLVQSSTKSVEKSLNENLKTVLRTKTTDDVSLALLVNISTF